MTKLIVLLGTLLCLVGCGEYIAQTVFEVETVDGRTLRLSCPVIDQGRSTWTYFIDHECRALVTGETK